jgi:hypothetical protein
MGVDRTTYFERCWPNSEATEGCDYNRLFEANDEATVTFEATTTDGRRSRNTAIFGFDDDKVGPAEV